MIPLQQWSAERVAEAWNGSVGGKYRIGPDLVERNLFGHSLFHETASIAEGDSFVAIKRSAASLYSGPDSSAVHLSLFAGRPTRALTAALSVLEDEGVDAVVVGTDSGHFIPGAPNDVAWMAPWLEERGFRPGGLVSDLQRDLADYRGRGEEMRADFRRLGETDGDALSRFLGREFPGRWKYDVMRKVEAEGPATVFGLFVDDSVEGFALLQREGCALPIGGAVWKDSLGTRWGALGPIGISKHLRGMGLGDALLSAALDDLSRHGARQTIIDWTGLIQFYGAHGFSVCREYRSYRLNLREDRPLGA